MRFKRPGWDHGRIRPLGLHELGKKKNSHQSEGDSLQPDHVHRKVPFRAIIRLHGPRVPSIPFAGNYRVYPSLLCPFQFPNTMCFGVDSSAGAGERFQLLDTLEWVYHARNGLATQEVSDES